MHGSEGAFIVRSELEDLAGDLDSYLQVRKNKSKLVYTKGEPTSSKILCALEQGQVVKERLRPIPPQPATIALHNFVSGAAATPPCTGRPHCWLPFLYLKD